MKKKVAKYYKAPKSAKKALDAFYTYRPIWDVEEIRTKVSAFRDAWNEQYPAEPSTYRSSREELLVTAEFALKELGFTNILSHYNPRLGRHSEARLDRHQVWVHPLGAVAEVDTYQEQQNSHRLNSIAVHASADMGFGNRLSFHLTRRSRGSSSGFCMLPNGHHAFNAGWNGTSVHELLEFLETMQQCGPLVPFSEETVWKDQYVGSLTPEQLVDVSCAFPDVPTKDIPPNEAHMEKLDTLSIEALEDCCTSTTVQSIPGLDVCLRTMLACHFDLRSPTEIASTVAGKKYAEKYKYNHQKVQAKFDWRHCEMFVDMFDRIACATLHRYPNEVDQNAMKAWLRAVLDHDLSSLAPAQLTHRAEAGQSILTGLMYHAARSTEDRSVRSGKNGCDLLLSALGIIPFDHLKTMCETPDKYGMGLLDHAINAIHAPFGMDACTERSIFKRLDEILSVIKDRYEKEGAALPVAGAFDHTLTGTWLRTFVQHNKYEQYRRLNGETLEAIKAQFESLGFAVNPECRTVLPYTIEEGARGNHVTEERQVVREPSIPDAWEKFPKRLHKDPVLFNSILKEILSHTIKSKSAPTARKI